MKPTHLLFRVLITLAFMLICTPYGQLYAAGAEGDEADHDALRAFKMLFEEAINTNNLELIEPYLNDPFSVVSYTDREFTDFTAFKAQWQSTREAMLKGGTYSVTLLPDRSLIYGDIAIAKGNSENTLVTGGGDEHRFTSKWTVVFRKSDGGWKIARVHSSLNPFSNSMIDTYVRNTIIKFVAASLIAGLVIGWLARRFLARKKSHASTPA